ncbi:MAG: winged helix-turn-helix domain-containing protein [Deltaproteobacteria bacterium]|nr:winged helix-turn-helix domain-containing protein [Deltaproteobacteria bacterium]
MSKGTEEGRSFESASLAANQGEAAQSGRLKVGPWRVEPDLLLIRNGSTVHRLEPRVMQLLLFLAAKAPAVVSREEIFQVVWSGRSVVDETLTRAVSLLRQAFGDDPRRPSYIETIPTRGYRMIASVSPVEEEVPEPVSTPAEEPTEERTEQRTEEPALSEPNRELRESALPETQPSPTLRPLVPGFRRSWILVAALLFFASAGLAAKWWRASLVPGAVEVAAPQDRPTIAVLPFENLSGEPRDLYLSDGLTEEIIHQLAGIGGLKVVSRISSMRFRDSTEPLASIAEQLGVGLLLEGSALVVEGRARISVRLLRLDQAEHLFSRTYDRNLEDILSLQRAVARDIARETQVRLTPAEQVRLSASQTVDPEAHRLYLQGQQALRRRTADDVRAALALLENAVEKEPGFALAWSSLADAHLLSVQFQLPGEGHRAAQRAIDRALALDSNLAQAHCAQGLLLTLRDQDWEGAEASYLRSIALEPSYATAHQWYSEMLTLAGRYEESLEPVRIAVELDPLSPVVHAALGQRLSAAKRYADAIWELESAEDLGASFSWHFRELGYAFIRLGDEGAAAKAFRREIERQNGGDAGELAEIDAAVTLGGLQGYWTWHHERLGDFPDSNPFLNAETAAATGQTELALRWLAKTLDDDIFWFLHRQRSPAFDGLRDDPRYLEQVGHLPLWTP